MLRRATLVLVVGLGAAAACEGSFRDARPPRLTPRDDNGASLMATPDKAKGALAAATFAVEGSAADRYKRALERALLRADLRVVDAGAPADFAIVLEVDVEESREQVDEPDVEQPPEGIDLELARYVSRASVMRGAEAVARLESAPTFELRTVTGAGAVLKTRRSKDQADAEFCGAGMNGLVAKLVHSAEVEQAAAALARPRPAASSSAGP